MKEVANMLERLKEIYPCGNGRDHHVTVGGGGTLWFHVWVSDLKISAAPFSERDVLHTKGMEDRVSLLCARLL